MSINITQVKNFFDSVSSYADLDKQGKTDQSKLSPIKMPRQGRLQTIYEAFKEAIASISGGQTAKTFLASKAPNELAEFKHGLRLLQIETFDSQDAKQLDNIVQLVEHTAREIAHKQTSEQRVQPQRKVKPKQQPQAQGKAKPSKEVVQRRMTQAQTMGEQANYAIGEREKKLFKLMAEGSLDDASFKTQVEHTIKIANAGRRR